MKAILRHRSTEQRRRARPQPRLLQRRRSARASKSGAPWTGAPQAGDHRTGAPETGASQAGAPQPGAAARRDAPAHEPAQGTDFAARRVRAAGGPTDEACYICACGHVFSAPVSATVACPRCGSEQAW